MKHWPLFLMLAILLAIGLTLGLSLPVRAHDWYDPACCSGFDCKPVDDAHVIETPQGVLVHGWGILSRSDPRIKVSKDDRSHICQMPNKLYCVYMKPNGS